MPGNAHQPHQPHPPGQAPTAQDDQFFIDEDSVLIGNLFAPNGEGGAEDSDPNGDNFTITAVNGQAPNVGENQWQITVTSDSHDALLTINPNGTMSLDLQGNFDYLALGDEATISFTYTISDGRFFDTATAFVTMQGMNDAPTLMDGEAQAMEDGDPVTVDLSALGSDVDTDDDGTSLTYMIVGNPAEGSASITDTTLTFDPGAYFQYLNDGETRDVVIQVQAMDTHGAVSNIADVTVTVAGVTEPVWRSLSTSRAGCLRLQPCMKRTGSSSPEPMVVHWQSEISPTIHWTRN